MRAPRLTLASVAATAVLLATSTAASTAVGTGEHVDGTCEITFHGISTLHGFSGTAASQTFTLTKSSDRAAGPAAWTTEIEIPVASLVTGNHARDRNMMKMFNAAENPYIVATFPRIDPTLADRAAALPSQTPVDATGAGAASPQKLELPFTLEIGNTIRKESANITHWKAGDHQASFDADFSVSLTSFGLKAPSVLGIIRVRDSVDVHAHVVLSEPRSSLP